MNNLKKVATVCLAAAMTLSIALTGCQSSGSSKNGNSSKKITLSFWLRDTRTSNLKAMNEIVKNYEAKHPNIKINVVQTPWSSCEQKVTTAVASNTLPDMSQLSQTGAADYGAKNILLNLDSRFKKTDFSNVTSLSMWQASYHGVHYAVPWFAGSNVLFYNKTLFKAAGIVDSNGDAKPPETWSEFLADAKKLTKDTNGDGAVDQWGFVERGKDDNNQTIREFMLAAGGGQYIDTSSGKDKVVIDTAANLKGLQFYLDLYQKYKVVPSDTLSVDGTSEEQKFLSGKIGMMFNGPWDLGTMQGSSVKWGVSLEPKYTKSACHIGGCPVGIFKSSKHPDEAYDFAKYLLSDSAQNIWAIKYGCGLPATKTMQEKAKSDPITKVFVEGLEAATKDGVTPPPQSQYWMSIDGTIAPPIWQKALLKEITPKQALEELQKAAEQKVSGN